MTEDKWKKVKPKKNKLPEGYKPTYKWLKIPKETMKYFKKIDRVMINKSDTPPIIEDDDSLSTE
jgi:hypothetical protein